MGASLMEEEQDKLPWSTPKLTEVTGSDEAQAIRLAMRNQRRAAA